MEWAFLVFPAAAGVALFAWWKYLGALKTSENVKRKITIVFLAVVLLFSAGFAMRLGGNGEIVDLGFYFTDFSFLMAYLLIAVAALLGQVKYQS